MSRAARNSKILRSGAIGFVAGLATLGVVAHGSPAHTLVASALGTGDQVASVSTDGAQQSRHQRSAGGSASAQQQLDQWLQQQSSQPSQPQQAQPQYQQPQSQNVQPAPSQAPQSQAS